MSMEYRYEPLTCPKCGQDWTLPSSIRLAVVVAGFEVTVPTALGVDGTLRDVDHLVATGHHSQTICEGCRTPLLDMDMVTEVQIQ